MWAGFPLVKQHHCGPAEKKKKKNTHTHTQKNIFDNSDMVCFNRNKEGGKSAFEQKGSRTVMWENCSETIF